MLNKDGNEIRIFNNMIEDENDFDYLVAAREYPLCAKVRERIGCPLCSSTCMYALHNDYRHTVCMSYKENEIEG